MKIVDARVVVTSPGRNFVTLKLTTDETFTEGHLHPGEAPGIGVELDEKAAAAHPYEAAYLPVNRLQDGTVHDW
ncbi:hypothetical protein GCM10010518_02310 [Kitasatospora cinereorecta]